MDGGNLELDPELAELAELRDGAVSGAFPAVTVDRATSALRSNDVARGRITRAELRDGDVVIVGEPDCCSLQVKVG
jgi:hypothetical protein